MRLHRRRRVPSGWLPGHWRTPVGVDRGTMPSHEIEAPLGADRCQWIFFGLSPGPRGRRRHHSAFAWDCSAQKRQPTPVDRIPVTVVPSVGCRHGRRTLCRRGELTPRRQWDGSLHARRLGSLTGAPAEGVGPVARRGPRPAPHLGRQMRVPAFEHLSPVSQADRVLGAASSPGRSRLSPASPASGPRCSSPTASPAAAPSSSSRASPRSRCACGRASALRPRVYLARATSSGARPHRELAPDAVVLGYIRVVARNCPGRRSVSQVAGCASRSSPSEARPPVVPWPSRRRVARQTRALGLVDTVLTFEGDPAPRHLLRASKHRYGPTDEVGESRDQPHRSPTRPPCSWPTAVSTPGGAGGRGPPAGAGRGQALCVSTITPPLGPGPLSAGSRWCSPCCCAASSRTSTTSRWRSGGRRSSNRLRPRHRDGRGLSATMSRPARCGRLRRARSGGEVRHIARVGLRRPRPGSHGPRPASLPRRASGSRGRLHRRGLIAAIEQRRTVMRPPPGCVAAAWPMPPATRIPPWHPGAAGAPAGPLDGGSRPAPPGGARPSSRHRWML
jgi:hypothetical protein